MATLALAIQKKEWELAALCLLLGVTRAAAALPPDAVEGLLEMLEAAPAQRPRGRRGERDGRFDRLRTGRGGRRP